MRYVPFHAFNVSHELQRILQICLCLQLGLSVICKECSEDAHKQ